VKKFLSSYALPQESIRVLQGELSILLSASKLEQTVPILAFDPSTRMLVMEQASCSLYALLQEPETKKTLTTTVDTAHLTSISWKTQILLDVLRALNTLHAREITYGALKSKNVLLFPRTARPSPSSPATTVQLLAKLGDFGLHTLQDPSKDPSALITAEDAPYLPPEALDAEGELKPDHRADVYSAGILANELLTQVAPWKGLTPSAISMSVCAKQQRPPRFAPQRGDALQEWLASALIGDAASGCLHQEPGQRPRVSELFAKMTQLSGGDDQPSSRVRDSLGILLQPPTMLDPVCASETTPEEDLDPVLATPEEDLDPVLPPPDESADDPVLPPSPMKPSGSAATIAPSPQKSVDSDAEDPVLPPNATGPLVTGAETGYKEHSNASSISPNTSHTASYTNHLDDEDGEQLVLDIGTSNTYAGFGGDDSPRWILPTCMMTGEDGTVIGDKAVTAALELGKEKLIHYPVRDGAVVERWDDYEMYLHRLFYDTLRCDPSQHGVALTESVLCSHRQRERQIQIMMESFNTPAFCLYQAPAMAAFGDGHTQCLSVMLGGGLVQIQPVHPDYNLSVFHTRMRGVGGEYMTDYLQKYMSVDHGYDLTRHAVNSVKHELCYVAKEYASEESKYAEKWTRDNSVVLGRLRCHAPEVLFDPRIVNILNDIPGLDAQICDVLGRLNEDVRRDMLANVRLYGGCAKLPGLEERLQSSLRDHFDARNFPVIRVRKSLAPEVSAWVGVSIASTMSSALSQWISRAEYDEEGPSIVNRRTVPFL
jgi:actin-related protein/serine/threonine protein kinase